MEELWKITLDTKAKVIHTSYFQLLCRDTKVGHWRSLKGKNGFISNMVLEESCTDTLDCQKDEQVGPRAN